MGRVTPKIKKEVEQLLNASYKDIVTIITPKNLSKISILKNKPIDIDSEIWIQNCRWIVHSIIQRSLDKRYSERPGGYVPLYSKVLKNICGNNYNTYLDGLINSNIIVRDGLYSKTNHFSFGFRLADKFVVVPLKHITITDTTLLKRIRKYRKVRIEELKIKASPISHLIRWFNGDGLMIEREAALEFLETYKHKLESELSKRNLKKKHIKKQETFVLRRYYKIKHQIESWGTNKNISIDDAGGRLYTPITGLPSLFRNFLTYNKQELVGFDIKNSQPLHFLITLKIEFWKSYTNGLTLKNLNNELWERTQGLVNKEGYTTIMFHKSSETQGRQGFHNYTFKNLIQNGKLYEFICFKFFNKYHTTGGMDRFNTRAKSKQEFMHMMYHNPKVPHSKAKEVFKEFECLFPVEASIMKLLKTSKHNDLPILLQKIEAQMLLHRVAKKVYDVNPDIPLFTVHDSMLTTKQYADTLKSILDDEYKNLLDFIPQFEKTEYSETNAYKELNKYTKTKVDQADLEITEEGMAIPDSFRFLKGEHWNFEKKEKAKIIKPDFAQYNVTPEGLDKATNNQNQRRKLKK